jgi:hypothetical protein
MNRTELAMGSTIFAAVIVAGFLSARHLDRHYAAMAVAKTTSASNDQQDPQAPATSPAACVGKDGSWTNWIWANVPMLSPKCAVDR